MKAQQGLVSISAFWHNDRDNGVGIHMITKKEKGDEQRKIVRNAVFTLGKPSTIREVYEACQKDPDFGRIFDCKDPYPRVRTILQRGAIGASQATKFRFNKIFIFDKAAKLWGANILAREASATPRLEALPAHEAMAIAAD